MRCSVKHFGCVSRERLVVHALERRQAAGHQVLFWENPGVNAWLS